MTTPDTKQTTSESPSCGAACSPDVSDTPETDAAFPLSTNWYYPDTPEYLERRRVAQKLERERNALLVDKARLDALETVSCWIGLEDDGYRPKAKWAAGGIYIHSVREIADFYLENSSISRVAKKLKD